MEMHMEANKDKIVCGFAEVINKYRLENISNTPDYILGEYLFDCFENFNDAVKRRRDWFVGGYKNPK